jgi:hypothetical protein
MNISPPIIEKTSMLKVNQHGKLMVIICKVVITIMSY